MSELPSATEQPPTPPEQSGSHSRLLKGLILTTATVATVAVAGTLGARYFIYQRLGPIVDDSITNLLGRPLVTGEVQGFTLRGITIDGATVPPTEDDGSYATVEAIRVNFNPLQLVNRMARDRTIPITLTLVKPVVYAEQDANGEWVVADIEISEEEGPVKLEVDRVQIQDARIVASPYPSQLPSPWENDGFWDTVTDTKADGIAPIVLSDLDGVLTIREENRYVGFDVAATLLGGGDIDVEGEADTQEQAVQAVLRSTDIQAAQFSSLVAFFAPDVDLRSGQVDANVAVDYHPDRPPTVDGTARIKAIEATLAQRPNTVANVDAQLRFDDQDVRVEDTRLTYGDAVVTAAGLVNLDTGYNLTAQLEPITIEALQDIAEVELPVEATGEISADIDLNGPLAEPVATGVVENTRPLRIDNVDIDTVLARFTATPPELILDELRILPTLGGAIAGTGRVGLEDGGNVDINITADDVPSDALAASYGAALPPEYRVGNLDADIDVTGPFNDIQAIARWQLPEATYAGAGELRYRNSLVTLTDARFDVEGGSVTADAIVDLAAGTWQAAVDTAGVRIDRFAAQAGFADQASGALTAALQLGGRLDNFDPSAIQLAGEATLANARVRATPDSPLLLDQGNWRSRFRWTGNALALDQLTVPGLEASGRIGADFSNGFQLGALDLAVLAQDFDLATVAAFLPPAAQEQVQLSGRATFDGQVRGPVTNPQVNGQLRLNDLAVNAVRFAALAGPVNGSLAGGTINLTDPRGGSDRITATIDEAYMPAQFALRNDVFDIEGQTVNQQLTATVRQLNLAAFGIDPLPGQGPGEIQGIVNANIEANLADLTNPDVQAAIAVAQPGLGYVVADQFVGQLSYRDRRATLADGEILLGDSRYGLDGNVVLRPNDPQFDAQLVVERGEIQDLVAALQWFDVADMQRGFTAPAYGSADDLATVDRGSVNPAYGSVDDLALVDWDKPRTTLLRRMLLAVKAAGEGDVENERRNQAILPSLTALTGTLDGQITATGSPQSGGTAEFNLDGTDISWGRYDEPTRFSVDGSAVATGGFEDVTLSLDPFDFYYGDGNVNLVATLNPNDSSGLLTVRDVSVGLIRNFVELPVDLDGQLYANASFGGPLTNPVVNAEVGVQDPQLNGTPFEAVRVDAVYDNAVLNFNGALAVDNAEQMTLVGQVPYPLPFAAVRPESNEILIDASLRNEGLALLNLVTQEQAQWESGEGNIDVRVVGTLESPQVLGRASFRDGVISSPLLPKAVTDITGDVTFDLSAVTIDTLTANLGDGLLAVSGALPISTPSGEDDKISITLEQLPVDFQDLFRATVDGDIAIAGSALFPVISGEIDVANGRVNATKLTGGGIPSTEIAADGQGAPSILNQITLDSIVVALDDSLQIAGQPLFSLATEGEVTVNGTAANPEPSGVITLASGWINIYATEFRVDRDQPNTVTFIPSQGLDPTLDVQMVARIRQVDRQPVAPSSPFAPSEVADQSTTPTFGGLNTVVIYAKAQGRASEITQSTDNITLTSDPSRSQRQLLALIGGSVIDSIGNGNLAVGAASFLGAGALSSFGTDVADAIGLSEFRIFPTTPLSDEAKLPLAIGVEAAIDITQNLSFSILEVIDGETDPQFGFRYQLTDEIRVRASSDLDDDTRSILEYNLDF
ncbi:MAG: translocation/assembly module TamB domain-containing protein [Elainellaceae cyanobacterium]